MSNKYIIKNCECKVKGKTTLCVRDIPYKKCENITDCVLKQIVGLCKKVNTKFYDSVHQRYLSPSKAKFARQILELLDIEEIK